MVRFLVSLARTLPDRLGRLVWYSRNDQATFRERPASEKQAIAAGQIWMAVVSILDFASSVVLGSAILKKFNRSYQQVVTKKKTVIFVKSTRQHSIIDRELLSLSSV